jgi:hypothetical protein
MIKKDFLQMIEEEFEGFDNERNKRKNLKMIVDFMSTNINHDGKEIIMSKPKLKAKLNSSFYIKNADKGNSLF